MVMMMMMMMMMMMIMTVKSIISWPTTVWGPYIVMVHVVRLSVQLSVRLSLTCEYFQN